MADHRPVAGFEGLYRVTDDGRVQSYHSGAWADLKPAKGHRGHLYVTLCRNGEKHTRYVHRLVLEAFVGPCPPGMECCHDPHPNPANCALPNLRWDTPKANIADSIRHGRSMSLPGESNGQAVLDEPDVVDILERRARGESIPSIVAAYPSVGRPNIEAILYGRSWKHLPRPAGLTPVRC
jgi:hypothetical protein